MSHYKDDQYGKRITAMIQGVSLWTKPNKGQMSSTFNEEVCYNYVLVNEEGYHCGRVELNVEQAQVYASENWLTIVPLRLSGSLTRPLGSLGPWRQPYVDFDNINRQYTNRFNPLEFAQSVTAPTLADLKAKEQTLPQLQAAIIKLIEMNNSLLEDLQRLSKNGQIMSVRDGAMNKTYGL